MEENKIQKPEEGSESPIINTEQSSDTSQNNSETPASVPPKKAPKPERKKNKRNEAPAQSLTSFLTKLITAASVRMIDSSRLVNRFTKNDNLKQACRESRYISRFDSGKTQLWLLNKKHSFLHHLENSHFRLGKKEISSTLMKTPLRYYGAFLLSFATICCFTYWMDFRYFGNYFGITAAHPTMCIPLLIIGIALLFLNETPSDYVRSSFFIRTIVFKCFGATIKPDDSPIRQHHYPATLLLGGAFGALTLLIPLKPLLLLLTFVICGAIILKSPETGVILTVAALFFIPFGYTCAIIIATWISFVFKFFSGKRVLKFEYIDTVILAVAMIILGGGIFSLGAFSVSSVMLPFFVSSLYFLIAGLIHDRLWADRCRMALTICGTVSALAVIIKRLPQGFFGKTMQIFITSELGSRTDSVIENSGVLILVISMLFFFRLASFYAADRVGEKAGNLLLCILFATAILTNTTTRAAILFVILALYAILILSKGLRFIIPLTAAFFIVAPVFGFPTVSELFAIAADDVITRHSAWVEYVKLFNTYGYQLLLFGIGLRPDAAAAVSHKLFAELPHKSLLLEGSLALGLPAVAFILFVAVIRILKYCHSHCRRCSDKKAPSRLYTHGGLFALAYMLLLGITENVGYNYRCAAFFWLILGLTVSAQRYAVWNTSEEYSSDHNVTIEF